jgi:hypothetical protein
MHSGRIDSLMSERPNPPRAPARARSPPAGGAERAPRGERPRLRP